MSPEPLRVRPLSVKPLGTAELTTFPVDGTEWLIDNLNFAVLDSDSDEILTTSP